MSFFYLVCVLVGGVLFLIQFVMGLFGHAGGDHDLDGHVDAHAGGEVGHETTLFTGILSVRAMVAGLTIFGLVGMLCLSEKFSPLTSLPIAMASAFVMMFIVAMIMRTFLHLKDEGTARIENAMGKPGTVYLPIPGQRGGLGKVTVVMQNRTVEYQAVTAEEPLPSGTKINVVKIIGADTVEVVPATSREYVS
jgi:membrane protein implicated in regulation of membrane protease activity